MISKVLIATDGSEHAAKAVAFGSDIAAKYGAELILLHVLLHNESADDLTRMAEVENLTTPDDRPLLGVIAGLAPGRVAAFSRVPAGEPGAAADTLEVVGKQILDRAERTAREHGVDRIRTVIDDGKPADRILAVAKSEGVDLIVTGARGLSDLQGLLHGSVSHRISHLSPVTCVTVR